MTCQEAERMITPYINNWLSDEELEQFLLHIKSCENCREELEIYFTVDYGIRQLDDEIGVYNIREAMEESLEAAWDRIKYIHVLTILKYVFRTLSVLWLTITLILQMRIWWQEGFFLK